MDDFYNRTQADCALFVMGKEFCRQQEENGAYTLASAGAQVLADIGDGAHAGDGVTPKLALNRGQVVAQQFEYFLGGKCGR